jgi:hypothetical protein
MSSRKGVGTPDYLFFFAFLGAVFLAFLAFLAFFAIDGAPALLEAKKAPRARRLPSESGIKS